ncbi:MAG TPA: HAD family hydrolase [Candidatus Saccharimonadales bacterium]|nr:HAD family hydrolase [Candidatus Saccharimonadales bacterium]
MILGVLLDVDGTLVLSNDAHAQSFVDAFAQYGYDVDFAKVRRLIGMGTDKLISTVRPELNEEEGDGKKIKEVRSKIFLEKYAPDLQPAPGSRQLVETLHEYGLRTIVASSSKSDELGVLLKAAQVDDLLTEATTSDDAENSKPDPDIVQVALDKIGLSADEVIMVGDTPYDIQAAGKAGVACIAVRCGGCKNEDLQGALGVYEDPTDLVRNQEEILTVVTRYVESKS